MRSAFELYESRLSELLLEGEDVRLRFSYACVHKSSKRPGQDPGSVWSQALDLVLHEASLLSPLPVLPDQVFEGSLDMGGIAFEFIPIPCDYHGVARLDLGLQSGGRLSVVGVRPTIEPMGTPIRIE